MIDRIFNLLGLLTRRHHRDVIAVHKETIEMLRDMLKEKK